MRITSSSKANDQRLHALDGLRAFAVILVFIHHIFVANITQGALATSHPVLARALGSMTAAGVELFFCLSGVVLLRRYLQRNAPLETGTYFWRRLTRLYPPFFFAWLFGGISIWLIDQSPTWWTETAHLANFDFKTFAREGGLGIGGLGYYNWAWWSLAPEVAFYCTVPLIVATLRRHADIDSAVMWLLISGSALSMTFSYAALNANHRQVLAMFAEYFSCFCVGILLARRLLTRRERLVSLTVGAFLLVLAFIEPRANIHVGYAFVFMPLIDACLRPASLSARIFGGDAMVWLGERSYSLFLIHFSVLNLACLVASLAFPKGPAYFLLSRTLALAGSMLITCLLFSFVERHFARGLVTANKRFPWSSSRSALDVERQPG